MDTETNKIFLSRWKALQSGRLKIEQQGSSKCRPPKYVAKLEEAMTSAFGNVPLLRKDFSTQKSIVSLVTAPFRRYRLSVEDVRRSSPLARRQKTMPKAIDLVHLPQPLQVLFNNASGLRREGSPRFIVPLETKSYFVSSDYGYRGERHHNGVDLAAEEGTPIRAAADGKVLYCGYESGYGNFIEVGHAGGWRTLYAHTKMNCKRSGDIVKANDMIAKVGSTGRSTGPHLHFEIRDPEDKPHNPALFMFLNRL